MRASMTCSTISTQATDGKVISLTSLWLANMVACFATKDVIYDLVNRDDISDIVYGLVPTYLDKPKLALKPASRDAVEPNLNVTQAPAAWRMGYTGQNVVVGEVDTGIWYTHMDLRESPVDVVGLPASRVQLRLPYPVSHRVQPFAQRHAGRH